MCPPIMTGCCGCAGELGLVPGMPNKPGYSCTGVLVDWLLTSAGAGADLERFQPQPRLPAGCGGERPAWDGLPVWMAVSTGECWVRANSTNE